MNETNRSPIYVITDGYHDFRRYCQEARLVPRVDAIFVSDAMDLRGVRGPIDVIWTETAPRRVDYDRLRDAVRYINGQVDPAVMRWEHVPEKGESVMVDGTPFIVTGIDRDFEGCYQFTLARRGSRCHAAHEQRENKGAASTLLSIATDGLRPWLKDDPAQCKCAFRAPELGPHPDCPLHR